MSFAIGVHHPRPRRPQPHNRRTLQINKICNDVSFDVDLLLKPKTSLLKHHKNAPMSFQIAVSAIGQSIQKRHEYLADLKKKNLRYFNSPLYKFAINIQLRKYTEVRWWFNKEASLKYKLRRFLNIWLQKKYKDRMLNTEDPFTLCEPENAVQIFDAKSRGTYVFDGKSIKKHIETCLGYNRWMMPEPREPTSPLTNLVLNLGQLISIRNQLSKHGMGSWMIEGFAKTKYTLSTFEIEFKLPLRLHALADLYRNPTCEDAIDEVREFISDQFKNTDAEVTNNELHALRWGVTNMPRDPYITEWRNVWRDYFKKYLVDPRFFLSESVTKSIIMNRIQKLFSSVNVKRIYEEWLKSPSPSPAPTPEIHHIDVLNTTDLTYIFSSLYLGQYQEIEIHGNDEETTESTDSSSSV
jgi:hypothetical protein